MRTLVLPRCSFAIYFFFLAAYLTAVPLPLYSQTELGAEDDLSVYGVDGTDSDPDTEIKGFSVFGATQAAYAGVTAGPGNVVVNGMLSVSSGAYFAANSTFMQGVTASSFTATGIGVKTAKVYLDPNVEISSAAAANYGGVYVSTNLYVNGKLYGDGSMLSGLGGTLSGGQTPKLPYWTSANALGNSTLAQDSASSLTAMSSTFTVQGGAFSVGGSALAVVAGSGVGIGTLLPSGQLDVRSDAQNPIRWGSSSNPFGKLAYAANVVNVGGLAGQALSLETNDGPVMRLTTGGDVGINTAAPSSKFEVVNGSVSIRGANAGIALETGSRGILPEASTLFGAGIRISTNVYIVGFASATKFFGDGSALAGLPGDNLGDHTATQNLNMANSGIVNISTISGSGIYISSYGVIQTAGPGLTGVVGNARGAGAVDLQAYRSGTSEVASGAYSVIAGGTNNTSSGTGAVATGGASNTSSGASSFVGGGYLNAASNNYATVPGGDENTASGADAVVPGGSHNTASGQYSFAAGYYSSSTVNGAFTWSDSQGQLNRNSVVDRTLFKNRGGFLVTGSTNAYMTGLKNRGVLITGNGTVGISTGVPYAALDVVSTGTAADVYAQIWRDGGGVTVASMTSQGVLFATLPPGTGDNLGNHTAIIRLNMAGNQIVGVSSLTVIAPTSLASSLWVSTSDATPQLYVSTTGNVGIGTAAPTRALHVYRSNPAVYAANSYSGIDTVYIQNPNTAGHSSGILFAATDDGGTGVASAIGMLGSGAGNSSLMFMTRNSGTDGEKVRIDNAGNVGISTNAPEGRLDVKAAAAVPTDMAQIWRDSNGVIVASMSATGVLMATRLIGPAATGDNLGNHTATQNLDMAAFPVVNVSSLAMLGDGLRISTSIYAGASGIFISTTGAIITSGNGNGTVPPGARGMGAIDLQTYRTNASFVASGSYATLSGGRNNSASGSDATVSGGSGNTANRQISTVSGGFNNSASGVYSAISGGGNNLTQGQYSTISGGGNNIASGDWATVSGGYYNTASNTNATVSGGLSNVANGQYSWAGGYNSSSTVAGAFTWSDSQGQSNKNTVADRTLFKNRGGFLITGSTNSYMTGLKNRGMLVTGDGLVGISTGVPYAALDVVSTGTVHTQFAQIWRDSDGVVVGSMSATGVLMAAKVIAEEIAGDDLGNHVAVNSLNMAGFAVFNVSTISASGLYISSYGVIQTVGAGLGTVAGNARGIGAVDLQVNRGAATRVASGVYAVVGGGQDNTAAGANSTVPGGSQNTAGNQYAVVSGGLGNNAYGISAAIPGGDTNSAGGTASFAAGSHANSLTDGAFTWADSGGVALNNNVVDRAVFKNRGGFVVTGSTNTAMTGTLDRGLLVTGNGLVGISTGAPYAALDVVSTGTTVNEYAQIWRDSGGVVKASMTATGKLYADLTASTIGDNLGDHNAAKRLNMAGNPVIGVSSLTVISTDTAASSLWVSSSTITPHLYVSTTGKVGVGTAGPQYLMDLLGGDINVGGSGVYRRGGTAGTSISCGGAQVLTGGVVMGGIMTGGTCADNGGVGSDTCDSDSVLVGNVCVDKYEASVWSAASGGSQYGSASDNYPCSDNGQDCASTNKIYARSETGRTPSGYLTWFQASAACRNAGKRLLTNAEWTEAANGTPDPGATGTAPNCNVSGSGPTTTGAGTSCLSAAGAENMIGSVWEWVADWGTASAGASNAAGTGISWPAGYNSDQAWNIGGYAHDGTTWTAGAVPAVLRGGAHSGGDAAGVFALTASHAPSYQLAAFGFRCGRPLKSVILQNGMNDLIEDLSPQLGADLDVNGHKIVSAANGNIVIEPDGTGNVGIGTVSPAATLHVSGGDVQVGDVTASTLSASGYMTFSNLASAPAAAPGRIYYDVTMKALRISTGTDAGSWMNVGGLTVGSVMAFPSSACPGGWMAANGAAVSRTDYSALFALLGTMYGPGDGSTTFNLPDYRGYFLRGWANGSVVDPDRAARTNRGDGTGGDVVGSKQADAFSLHNHGLAGSGVYGGGSYGAYAYGSGATFYTGTTGGNETRPENINTLYCINYSAAGGNSDAGGGGGGVGGSGSANYVAKFTDSTTLGSSSIYDASGNIGIGTSGPLSKLDVYGGLAVGTYAGANAAPSNSAIISGNLGVGTAVPTATLDVNGSAQFGSGAAKSTFTAAGNLQLVSGSTITSNGTLTLSTAATAATASPNLFISTAGNVGIGTTSPGYDSAGWGASAKYLTVLGPGSADDAALIQVGRGTAIDNEIVGVVDFINTGNTGAAGAGRYAIAQIRATNDDASGSGGDSGGHMSFITKADAGDAAERMRITSAGNLGIGTATPAAKLTIQPGTLPTGTISAVAGFNGSEVLIQADGANINSKTGYWGRFADAGIAGGMTIGRMGSVWGTYIAFHNHPDSAATLDNSPELMRIDMAGNVGIGTPSPSSKLTVQDGAIGIVTTSPGSAATMSYSAGKLVFGMDSAGTDGISFRTYSGGYAERLKILTNGNVGIGTETPGTYRLYVNGTGYLNAASWTYGSDKRLKENISYIGSGLDIIERLKPAEFDYIEGDKKQAGFIAQDVREVLPNIVTEGANGMLGIKTDSIIPYLVKAIQEQQKEINALKAKLADK